MVGMFGRSLRQSTLKALTNVKRPLFEPEFAVYLDEEYGIYEDKDSLDFKSTIVNLSRRNTIKDMYEKT